MNEPLEKAKLSRILVALDASPYGQAALETAVRLASAWSAELQGLFVEDVDLLRLASLPFAREIGYSSAAPRQLDSTGMERTLRSAAELVRRTFTNVAQQSDLHWSFRVARGRVIPETLSAASEVDLLIIGRAGRSPRSSTSLVARHVQSEPVVVVFDGASSGHRALDLAINLARKTARPLLVLLPSSDGFSPDELRGQITTWIQSSGLTVEIRELAATSSQPLVDLLRRRLPSVLVYNRVCELMDDAALDALVNELDCPIAIVY